jgi:hypothetical protein
MGASGMCVRGAPLDPPVAEVSRGLKKSRTRVARGFRVFFNPLMSD